MAGTIQGGGDEDEMISGIKWGKKWATHHIGVKADNTTWGQGNANGFSACALTGRADIMELGGIRHEGGKKLFLISTTHGAETTGLAAMLHALAKRVVAHAATVRAVRSERRPGGAHARRTGRRCRDAPPDLGGR